MLRRFRALLMAGLVLACTPPRAHDFWIEPTSFAPAAGQIVGLRLRVGEHLVGDPVALVPALVKRFVLADTLEARPVVGRQGGDPAGVARVTTPGLSIVGYVSQPNRIELAADRFNAYLTAEGLEAIGELRARRNQSGAQARELYVRCAKSLLLVAPADMAQGDRRLGLPLELVAERNPYAMADGADLPLRLSFEDQPLSGALVVAINSLRPTERQAARTDRDGRVRLQLLPGGMWLVKAVHMIPAPADTDVDWLSFWASLTFEVHAASQ
jgi:Domain of unknown function (DUF4198)